MVLRDLANDDRPRWIRELFNECQVSHLFVHATGIQAPNHRIPENARSALTKEIRLRSCFKVECQGVMITAATGFLDHSSEAIIR